MEPAHLESIDRSLVDRTDTRKQTLATLGKVPSPEKLAGWFETLLSVQKSATGSKEFFEATARAVVDLIGLDHGIVLLREPQRWHVAAQHSIRSDTEVTYSETVHERVVRTGQTCYESFAEPSAVQSLTSVQAYVASPILDAKNEVVGVLFGSRDLRLGNRQTGIEPLEAHVVQLLAGIVSASLARSAIEAEATRFRVQLEQFASPKLVSAMRRDPSILDARDRDITVLFADIRGFTGLAERLGAEKIYKLIRNVMDRLTGCILDFDGLIIDYSGDGIAAMWNAPTDQKDHAALACRAAISMQREMKKLSEFWGYISGETVAVGIGINSGPAQVGNSGSRWRLKYSALGHTVNLASRVEGATKHFQAPVMLTDSTCQQLGDEFATRRIGPVKFWGIEQPFQLFQLFAPDEDRKTTDVRTSSQYEQALEMFERGEFDSAIQLTRSLIAEDPDDRPSIMLQKQIDRCQQEPSSPWVIRLDSK